MQRFGKILGALFLAPTLASAQPAGNTMAVPPDYRQWVFLTSSLDLNYDTSAEASTHMLDNVYVDPKGYKVFLESGTWPDKTVLIKENRFAQSAGTLSRRGQFQAGVKNLEIHVKDEALFPGKWAFFVSSDGKAAGELKPQSASCYSCHQAHGAVDTSFVQFYPTLLPIAKDKGTLSANYLKNDAPK
jgi:hypothetical protein